MTRRKQIYEGKAKVMFEGPEPGTLVLFATGLLGLAVMVRRRRRHNAQPYIITVA